MGLWGLVLVPMLHIRELKMLLKLYKLLIMLLLMEDTSRHLMALPNIAHSFLEVFNVQNLIACTCMNWVMKKLALLKKTCSKGKPVSINTSTFTITSTVLGIFFYKLIFL
jgi:hypothetical protein